MKELVSMPFYLTMNFTRENPLYNSSVQLNHGCAVSSYNIRSFS